MSLILVIALIVRLGYLPYIGYQVDFLWNLKRAAAIQHNGLFKVYQVKDTDYPPVVLMLFGIVGALQAWRGGALNLSTLNDPTLITLFKIFPLVADFALIVVLYYWLRKERWLCWLIPLTLAISPGLLLDSALWGQSDSLMALFVILVLLALSRDKPLLAWLFFAAAMLTKFQSVVLLPLLVILTLRRYGRRALAVCTLLASIIGGVVLLPFFIGSGVQPTLMPYLSTVGEYPVVTANALNLWYVLSPHKPGVPLPWPDDKFSDATSFMGIVSYKQAGFVLLGLYVLFICCLVWRQAGQHREFIWAAALYLSFFMLPTEIHERYLYPTAVLLIIAITQQRRVWPLAIVSAVTLAYNLEQVLWPDPSQALGAMCVALLNIGLFVEVSAVALHSATRARMHPVISHEEWQLCLKRAFWSSIRILGVVIGGLVVLYGLHHFPIVYRENTSQVLVRWINSSLPNVSAIFVIRGSEIAQDVAHNALFQEDDISDLCNGQVPRYFALGEADRSKGVNTALAACLSDSVLVKSITPAPSIEGSARYVYRTAKPEFASTVTYGRQIALVGYDLGYGTSSPTACELLRFRPYWRLINQPASNYSVFIHVTPEAGNEIVAQYDGVLITEQRPTLTWLDPNELYIGPEITLKPLPLSSSGRYRLEIGIYDYADGERLTLPDGVTDSYPILVGVPCQTGQNAVF